MALQLPAGARIGGIAAKVDGVASTATLAQDGRKAVVAFPREPIVEAGEAVELAID
jgi:hypothetical protein